jgi:hypothetical protein
LTIYLSKSRIQSGRQCHKRLWLELHQPDAADVSDIAQSHFDEGDCFGELARTLLGGGALIEADHRPMDKALLDTAEQLLRPRESAPLLFEPAFLHESVGVRLDALRRDVGYDTLIEVKSSTVVKPEYLWDCAIQAWVARGAGRPIARIELAHANNKFVYKREGDYIGLLVTKDITGRVDALVEQVPGLVSEFKSVATGDLPDIRTGEHCKFPYECPFLTHCSSAEPAPPPYPLSAFPRVGKPAIRNWRDLGYRDVRDVPLASLASPLYRRIAQATRAGEAFVSDAFGAVLASIPYPRWYLDFETISFVVPRWIGTRPFQQIPFQFSCHRQGEDGSLEHAEFLDLSGHSPSHAFAQALLASIDASGPILVWNQGFEAGRIRELAATFPEMSVALLGLVERMIDLLPLYREHYYHPDMLGLWSIKKVLPTIAPEMDYAGLSIGGGRAAQAGYLRATAPGTEEAERRRIDAQLREYCGRDTLAMVCLANWLDR